MNNHPNYDNQEKGDDFDFLTFTDKEYGVQIQYPSDWNYSRGIQRSMVASFVPPPNISKKNLIDLLSEDINKQDEVSADRKLYYFFGDTSASVALYSFASFDKTLEKIVQDKITELEQEFPDFVMVSSKLQNIHGGIDGYEIIYTGTLSGNQKKKVLTVWITKDGKIYQITYFTIPEVYPLYLNIVNQMIESFSFI
jgi:hypothetical protein